MTTEVSTLAIGRGSDARPHGRARDERTHKAARTFTPVADHSSHYLSDVRRVPLLNRAEELAIAREIEALEIAHWCALLSYRPALEQVADAVCVAFADKSPKLEALVHQACLEDTSAAPSPDGERAWTLAVQAVARELRQLDQSRDGLRQVDRVILRAREGDVRARAYLERVRHAGDAQFAVKHRFVSANLRLVVGIAARSQGLGLPLADLIQEGNLGLLRAVERYDHQRGLRFSTYATFWIRHYINRAITDKAGLIRVPAHAQEARGRVERARQRTIQRTGEPPSDSELARDARVDSDVLRELESARRVRYPHSLDRTVGEGGDATLHELLADLELEDLDAASDRAADRQRVRQAMAVLSSMEAAILRFRFGFDNGDELTLKEVGDRYHLSRERIRQVQNAALAKLRVALKSAA